MTRFTSFTKNGLGHPRDGSVQLMPHNPRFKRLFSDEAHALYSALRIERLRLYHVGSTAVTGLPAKPILDILGSVPSLAELDEKRAVLEALGYEVKGEYGIEGRRFAVLYNPEKTESYVHLHLFQEGSADLARHLKFRDLLRKDSGAKSEYQAIKEQLLQSKTPREDYTKQKGLLVNQLEARALAAPEGKRVLALLGAAPGGKNTEEFLREKYAGQDLEVVDLSALELRPYHYRREAEAEPAFLELVDKMIEADLVVFATPIYWYSMAGSLKNFVDRFSDLLRGPHQNRGERLAYTKVKLLSTGADPALPLGFETPFALTSIYLAMDYLGADYRSY